MKLSHDDLLPYALTVVDTNVLISAALAPKGAPAAFLDELLQHGRLVFTDATFAEIESRIWKPKFDRYISIEARQELLRLLNASAVWAAVSVKLQSERFSRDFSDDIFLHAAFASNAKRIVTGDDDLLSLGALQPSSLADKVKILSPRSALNELRKLTE